MSRDGRMRRLDRVGEVLICPGCEGMGAQSSCRWTKASHLAAERRKRTEGKETKWAAHAQSEVLLVDLHVCTLTDVRLGLGALMVGRIDQCRRSAACHGHAHIAQSSAVSHWLDGL